MRNVEIKLKKNKINSNENKQRQLKCLTKTDKTSSKGQQDTVRRTLINNNKKTITKYKVKIIKFKIINKELRTIKT